MNLKHVKKEREREVRVGVIFVSYYTCDLLSALCISLRSTMFRLLQLSVICNQYAMLLVTVQLHI